MSNVRRPVCRREHMVLLGVNTACEVDPEDVLVPEEGLLEVERSVRLNPSAVGARDSIVLVCRNAPLQPAMILHEAFEDAGVSKWITVGRDPRRRKQSRRRRRSAERRIRGACGVRETSPPRGLSRTESGTSPDVLAR